MLKALHMLITVGTAGIACGENVRLNLIRQISMKQEPRDFSRGRFKINRMCTAHLQPGSNLITVLFLWQCYRKKPGHVQ